MISKKIIYLFLFLGLFCVTPLTLGQIGPTSSYADFPALLAGIASELGKIITILGGLMIVVAGFLYMTSAGDPGRMKTAKTALTYAIGGIVVGLTATAIADFVKGSVQGQTLTEIITGIATTFGTFMAAAGVIMIIVAGILYLVSGGDPAKMKIAKTALIYAVVGIAIGLSAVTIVNILKEVLTT